MLESMKGMLLCDYAIQALSVQEVPAGWSASAWKVHTASGDYFLKVFDKTKPSTKVWLERIDTYMPVVLWLNENTKLHGRMTAPLLNKAGTYKTEDADFLYMVFPFIQGQTIGGEKLTSAQAFEIAAIVAELHRYGAEIPIPTKNLRETFDVSFCNELAAWLREANHHPEPICGVLLQHEDVLLKAIKELQKAASVLHSTPVRFALCHTDIHGWNLMQGESLILIDWEGLKLAPVESDLFSFTKTFFFADAWGDFMTVYRTVHKDYQINEAALRFYRLRRRLEDIHAFAQSYFYDALTENKRNQVLHYLKQECGLLHGM